jgi:hypothetical protein
VWQIASEDGVIVDALLEKFVMLTRGIREFCLPDACQAESRCDCACLVAKISDQLASHQNFPTVATSGALVFDGYVA